RSRTLQMISARHRNLHARARALPGVRKDHDFHGKKIRNPKRETRNKFETRMRENGAVAFRNFSSVIVSDFGLRISKLSGNDLGSKLESSAAILFLPKQMIGVGEHLGDFEFARFREP